MNDNNRVNNNIDFVMLWVDGNDEEWLAEKNKYSPTFKNNDNDNKNRYRDWNNLQYWFRGVEKYASWVNKIYFITWGHVPAWLNLSHPKLEIINHKDYIPKEFLPTYNSNTIELNLYKLEKLSENFVLFNDDLFIISETTSTDFFKKNLPVEYYSECLNTSITANDTYSHNILNNMSLINKQFNKRKMLLKNFTKYINFKYGMKGILSTILLAPFNHYSMIENQHLCVSLKKSVLQQVWEENADELLTSSRNRFRNLTDVSQLLIRYYQLCSGNFFPRSYKFGKSYALNDNIDEIINDINKHKYKVICLNDTTNVQNFELSKNKILDFLEQKFPEKSSFEK